MLLRRIVFCLVALAPQLSAQTPDAGRFELTYGFNDLPGTPSRSALALDGAWQLGAFDLQLGGRALSEADQTVVSSVRLIASRAVSSSLRLGASVALTTDDGVATDVTTWGLHALVTRPELTFQVAASIPDHVPDSGAFAVNMVIDGYLTSRIRLNADLYRLSTDDETNDYFSYHLGLSHDFADNWTLGLERTLTVEDEDSISSDVIALRLSHDLSQRVTLQAAAKQGSTDRQGNFVGIDLGFRVDLGAGHDTLSAAGPNRDRFGEGLF